MTTRIKREDFLRALDSAAAGLTSKEVIQQSDCYILQDGYVAAYNEEVLCRAPTGLLKSVNGAVKAKPLTDMLRKLAEEELDVSFENGKFILHGKGAKRTEFAVESEVLLPVASVEQPSEWKPLDSRFPDAIATVQQCASNNEARFEATCVNVNPEWVEALDDMHCCRWKITTPISKATLIRRTAIKHVSGMNAHEIGETDSFVHFRNAAGVVLSCRRYMEDFPPGITKFLEFEGTPVTLPKGLDEACERAAIAANTNIEHNLVTVKLRPGKMTVIGEGLNLRHVEPKKVAYTGKKMEFLIAPAILAEVAKKSADVTVCEDRLRIISEKGYIYVTVLRKLEKAAENGETNGSEGNGE